MKKILIVDDQSLNQTLLEAYINQYAQQHNETMEIRTANDGLQAALMAEDTPFDLIFMDILMPNMNGIEATKRIHAILPKAIIVIVSTQGDEENQIQALRNGAKDYFIKPIQPDVFKHRLGLYLSIMNNTKAVQSKRSQNLFTNHVFCYHTTYIIENEEDLTELWESLLFKIKDSVRTNFLSDLIRFMYQLGIVMLSRKVQPKIIMEENENDYFFSILNINIIPSHTIQQLIGNYFTDPHYLIKSNILSFRIKKEYVITPDPILSISEKPAKEETIITYEKQTEVLQRFDFMEEEDLTSLELKLNELSTQFMWMGSNELNADDIDQIVNAFERASSILLLYTETQTLGLAIRTLSDVIKKDEQKFIEIAPQMSTLCKSFNNDLIVWHRSLFYDGAPSVHYMDASILSNIQMIQSFLEPEESLGVEGDDGLEFF